MAKALVEDVSKVLNESLRISGLTAMALRSPLRLEIEALAPRQRTAKNVLSCICEK